MKFLSPLPIEECRAVLREQIGARSSVFGFRFRKSASRVVGEFNGEEMTLESGTNLFTKRLVGRLSASPEGSVLEAEWRDTFGSSIYGKLFSVEHEILRFLEVWPRFKKISD